MNMTELLLSVGKELLRFAGQLLTQPFYYLSIVLLFFLYRKQGQHERFSFHVRKQPWFGKWLHSIGWGFVFALLISIVFVFVGAEFSVWTVVWLWGITLLLMLFRVRLFSFTYAVSILIILHFGLIYVPEWFAITTPLPRFLNPLIDVEVTMLLLLSGLLLGIEALIFRLQKIAHASPLYLIGKRGKPVGGFHLLQILPVPLMLLVPASGAAGLELAWSPVLLDGVERFMLLPLPLLLGYNSWTAVQLPEEKARKNAIWLLLLAIVLIGMALASVWVSWLAFAGAVLFLILREVLVWKSARDERLAPPRFVNNSKGLQVLDVIANSPADELGIKPGEILFRVNGHKPKTVDELHQALRHSPAYCKLEVINLQGESKFLKRAIFEGDHHLLGVLLAPSDVNRAMPVKATESLWKIGPKK